MWQARRTAVAFLVVASCVASASAEAASVKDVRKKMGSRFEITAVHPDEGLARTAIEAAYAEIDRIEGLISSWLPTSATTQVNDHAGLGPVAVPSELFELVRRSLKVSELTRGAFDITFAGAGRLWDFKSATPRVPKPEEIRAALEVVGYELVKLDPDTETIELTKPGMRIGFGAIGKGYAANRAARLMKDVGIDNGVVNAGGDLLAFGAKEDGLPWTVSIANPQDRDSIFAYLRISDQAVVTSGDYESFIEIEGVHYSHILDPRTGFPVRDVRSATVVCADAELADALATAVSVMGPTEGLVLLNRLHGVEGLIVDGAGNLHFTDHLESRFAEQEKNE